MGSISGVGHLSRYVTSHQVSSVWPSLRGYRRNEYQPKGVDMHFAAGDTFGERADSFVWVAGKTV